ncbi:hypothetical protein CYLTODRAFT_413254 [Cylindrobasidium torrendii FP15055 ss-10]|uniref:Uncharacterized protein n=1 Tax=Cylindrobasidium torrendii FP15055 ss-10 TaxID=1314674 RepID=A0A0D7B2X5_9AGAR|nr:hypothetical protein CYLTODRAFT_413254 [Cylindrobasidium torrendii FP15055 ss-10]
MDVRRVNWRLQGTLQPSSSAQGPPIHSTFFTQLSGDISFGVFSQYGIVEVNLWNHQFCENLKAVIKRSALIRSRLRRWGGSYGYTKSLLEASRDLAAIEFGPGPPMHYTILHDVVMKVLLAFRHHVLLMFFAGSLPRACNIQ